MRGGKRTGVWAAVALSVGGCALVHAEGLPRPLPSQPLSDALDAFARATGVQIIYSADLAKGVISPGASPGLGIDATLAELLRGTGLTFEHINDRTITLVRKASAGAPANAAPAPELAPRPDHGGPVRGKDGSNAHRIAGVDELGPTPFAHPVELASWRALEQIVVTGSHIPGFEPVGTTVIELSRADIERSGYTTVEDLIRALPQSFRGGPNGATHGHGEEELYNASHAEGVNLRGLGAGSTLVLVDGRRIAPGAAGGRFVDVSVIPISAIERIEILPEGASAIYGADAVGGVINVILRDDYRGAETEARLGATTGNGPNEALLAQTLGGRWASGNALVTLEYWRRGDLPVATGSETGSCTTCGARSWCPTENAPGAGAGQCGVKSAAAPGSAPRRHARASCPPRRSDAAAGRPFPD